MINLLKVQLVAFINAKKSHLSPFDGSLMSIKDELISDKLFDIEDLKQTIKQPAGTGTATYDNPNETQILFIDYENFINQLPAEHQKNIKKCDFIAFDQCGNSFFIFNELSGSSSARNKFSKAREQLHSTLLLFESVPEIKTVLDSYARKLCIFSNKTKVISSPNGMAASFERIKSYLPDPIPHDYQPITKMGFEFIETAIVAI